VATVSVIIPAIEESARVGRAVSSAWQAGADEVLVVDGGSTDDTCRQARAAGARVLETTAGRAVQQAHGADHASGDWLVFLHADNWLGATALAPLREGVFGGRRLFWGAMRQRISADGWVYRGLEQGNAWRVHWRGLPFGDQALWVDRECYAAVGGFPPLPLMEDVYLSQQLRRRAWPVLLDGPVHISARRWQRHGVVRQTLRNWSLQWRHARGASPEVLASRYRRHDAE
jgi:rSAM/selenodomain-associated transferase 2